MIVTLYPIGTEAVGAPIWADKIPKWIFTLNRGRSCRLRAAKERDEEQIEREREPLSCFTTPL